MGVYSNRALQLLEAYDKAAHAYADACHGGDAELRDQRLAELERARKALEVELS